MSELPTRAPDEPARTAEVLVIGGAGFIGSHLVERLLAAAVSVDVVDDLSSGSLANLASARETARINGGDLRIHTVDAGSPDLAGLMSLRRPQHIFHLAVAAPGRAVDPVDARPIVRVDPHRARGGPAGVGGEGGRAAAGDGDARQPVGQGPAGQGGRDRPARRARRRGQGDRRPARRVPGAARHRVHRARRRRACTARDRTPGGASWRRCSTRPSAASRPGSPATGVRRATSSSSTTSSTP